MTDPVATTGRHFTDRRAEARAVLDRNWTGTSTIPAAGLYPHQWNWDTGFIAIGHARYDQARAEIELASLFRGQWSNGMLPHIVFNPQVDPDAYFPGQSFWRAREHSNHAPKDPATSGITQPPIHAFAALQTHRYATDAERSRAFLEQMFPKLVALHRYFRDSRGGEEGLAFLLHPWETGLDDSPAWDEAFLRVVVPEGSIEPYKREDLKHGDKRDRPSDEDYDRFVYLATIYRDSGYDDARIRETAPFLIEDPLLNTLWAVAADALAEIAGAIGKDGKEFAEDRDRIVRAMESKLWDDEHGEFFPFDVRNGARMGRHSVVSLVPILAPGLDRQKANRTVEAMARMRHAWDEEDCYLVPSYQIGENDFSGRLYWRGPLWVNTNWIMYQGCRRIEAPGIAQMLRDAVLSLVGQFGCREYYDPHGDAAHGAKDFSWTAALYLDMCADGDEFTDAARAET
jgi:Mannosylglycerate hydrolase MGH1-like glycoside hydrolase domain